MKTSFRLSTLAAFVLACAAPSAHSAPASPALFKDGDRWSVVGDSVTQSGTYYAWVYLYYATRFPGINLEISNCGISGDSASGALTRYDWDIAPKRPTVATVMFGMNDVNRGLYSDAAPTPETLQRRKASIETCCANVAKMAGKLQQDGARVIFLTPSPFDETADLPVPRQTGVNGALGECGKAVTKLAGETGQSVIDFHTPMTALQASLQAADPKATLTGPDRIHPQAPGHFVMAYEFLKAQHAPAEVSTVVIDAAARKAALVHNAEVKDLAFYGGGLSFKCLEKSLPYPVLSSFSPALAWVPFMKDFNQEILRVQGLPKGSYSVSIDGELLCSFPAEKLAEGINLAEMSFTPQGRQAEHVGKLVAQWQGLVSNCDRGVAQVEYWMLKDLPRPVDLEAAQPILQTKLDQMAGSDAHMDKYNTSIIKRYLQYKPVEAGKKAEIRSLAEQIRTAEKPVAHTYRIAPSRN